ncbi:hypothetical protein V5F40_06680 [Xanthobacter sp. DSM 14520]|uniref:hypothetical protein n=1 Tax=Xanthobacter autotrophicus (strain ATCC BAA-1158 / Py2) TaxID=78245 RepID=UPI003729A70F
MSIPVWPADLPQRVLVDGFSAGVADGRIRQKMDAGPPKMRRRTSAAVRPVRARVRLDRDGVARLNRFWEEDTAGGVLPFWFPDPLLDGLPLLTGAGVPLLTDGGEPLLITSWWLVQFGEDGIAVDAPSRVAFSASFGLDILP